MRIAPFAVLMLASHALAQTPPALTGTFSSKGASFKIAGGLAFNGKSSLDPDTAVIVVAISNASLNAEGLTDFVYRKRHGRDESGRRPIGVGVRNEGLHRNQDERNGAEDREQDFLGRARGAPALLQRAHRQEAFKNRSGRGVGAHQHRRTKGRFRGSLTDRGPIALGYVFRESCCSTARDLRSCRSATARTRGRRSPILDRHC